MAIEALPQSLAGNPARMEGFLWTERGQSFTSSLTGATSRVGAWGAWSVDMEWTLRSAAQAMPMISFLRRYQFSGEFLMYDPPRCMPRGAARGGLQYTNWPAPSTAPVGEIDDTPVESGGGTCDITVTSPGRITRAAGNLHAFAPGTEVVISGATLAANNGTFTVADSDDNDANTIVFDEDFVGLEVAASLDIAYASPQTGRRVATKSWVPSVSGLFLAGDLFGVDSNGEVYEVRADADSNTEGKAVLQFSQMIRASPVDGDSILAEFAPFKMRLTDLKVSTVPPVLHSFSFSAVESLHVV